MVGTRWAGLFGGCIAAFAALSLCDPAAARQERTVITLKRATLGELAERFTVDVKFKVVEAQQCQAA